MRAFLSIDIDITELQVNQCNAPTYLYEYQTVRNGKSIAVDEVFNQIDAFHASHKCHPDSMQVYIHICHPYMEATFSLKFFYVFCSVIISRFLFIRLRERLRLPAGLADRINAFAVPATIRNDIQRDSMEPLWKWLIKSIEITKAPTTKMYSIVKPVLQAVRNVPVIGLVWPRTIGHFACPC